MVRRQVQFRGANGPRAQSNCLIGDLTPPVLVCTPASGDPPYSRLRRGRVCERGVWSMSRFQLRVVGVSLFALILAWAGCEIASPGANTNRNTNTNGGNINDSDDDEENENDNQDDNDDDDNDNSSDPVTEN